MLDVTGTCRYFVILLVYKNKKYSCNKKKKKKRTAKQADTSDVVLRFLPQYKAYAVTMKSIL